MTYEERITQEILLGRRMTDVEEREYEIRKIQEIKPYANWHLHTDVYPYEVVRKISKITVEVRKMEYEQTKFPSEFYPGGFSGHYADNAQGQDYDYRSCEYNPIIKIRFSKSRRCWINEGRRFIMSDKPYRHYDYNF